jgi:deazaflavin-dependent oxidoreductase (nitroreductase family)
VDAAERARIEQFWKHHQQVWQSSNATQMTKSASFDFIEVITTGRRSGRQQSAILSSLKTALGWIVIASNLGADNYPAWYLNLRDAGMRGKIRVANSAGPVEAEAVELEGEDRRRAWDAMTARESAYLDYEKATSRFIPVIELRELQMA